MSPGRKNISADVHVKGGYVDVVYKMEELTVCHIFLLQLGCRAGENGRVLQTQLADRAHWLGSHSEVTVSLGWDTLMLYNSIWLCFRRG